MFGHKDSILKSRWPKFDPKAISFDTVVVAVQINGKVRDEIEVERNADEETVKSMALSREKVQKNIEGKTIIKVIFVKGKLLEYCSQVDGREKWGRVLRLHDLIFACIFI